MTIRRAPLEIGNILVRHPFEVIVRSIVVLHMRRTEDKELAIMAMPFRRFVMAGLITTLPLAIGQALLLSALPSGRTLDADHIEIF